MYFNIKLTLKKFLYAPKKRKCLALYPQFVLRYDSFWRLVDASRPAALEEFSRVPPASSYYTQEATESLQRAPEEKDKGNSILNQIKDSAYMLQLCCI